MERTPEVSGAPVVQVGEPGQLTVPAEIRRPMELKDDDVFSLLRLGNILVATRKRFVTPGNRWGHSSSSCWMRCFHHPFSTGAPDSATVFLSTF